MRARILIVVVAWLLGAATATGGSLMAVSLLGDGFGVTGGSGQQLTAAGVNQALAAARRESSSQTPAATPSRPARARRVTRRPRAATPTPTPTSAVTPSPTPTPTPAQSTTPVGTPFSSQGGNVVAACESGGATLLSWNAAQGYEVDTFVQGPAPVANVKFETISSEVTMSISCPNGPNSTPVSNTTTGTDH